MNTAAAEAQKPEDHATQAKARWGKTQAYQEYETKRTGRTDWVEGQLGSWMMTIFEGFGALRGTDPAAEAAQEQVKKLQDYITKHFYACSKEVLAGLGQMYVADSRFAESIDKAGGTGTAAFAAEAIAFYCGK